MEEQRLVHLLSEVLGPGHKQGSFHYYFKCPACQHKNHKLAVQVVPDNKGNHPWQCFHCKTTNKTGGKSIRSLLKRFNFPQNVKTEIYTLLDIKPTKFAIKIGTEGIQLPKEFKPLYKFKSDNPYEMKMYDVALTYLVDERHLTIYDILKYNIGFCLSGDYSNRIIFPSYDESNNLNFFTSRSFTSKHKQNYKNPPNDKTTIIPFENTINWNEPIILVEGVFDMFSIKRNALPLLGKSLYDTILKKLLSSNVTKIYICLDNDACQESLKHCKRLMEFGKEVYFVDLTDKDPNTLGFDKINEILYNTYPLSFYDMMKLQIRNIK